MANKFLGMNINSAGDGVRDAFGFWGEAMRELLPLKMQRELMVGDEYLLLELKENSIVLSQFSSGVRAELGTFEHKDGYYDQDIVPMVKKYLNEDMKLLLCLQDSMVLQKQVNLPSALLNSFKQSVYYELEKYTPFKRDKVFYDAKLLNKLQNNISVGLYIVPQAQVKWVIDLFAEANLKLDGITCKSDISVNMLPEISRRKNKLIRPNVNWIYAILAIIIAIMALAGPLYYKEYQVNKIQEKVEEAEAKAQGERELWAKKDAKTEALTEFVNSQPVSFASVFEALSKTIPDHTWVTQLVYRNGELSIRGESAAAADLPVLLNQHPFFNNAELETTVKSRSGGETYRIKAQVARVQGAISD